MAKHEKPIIIQAAVESGVMRIPSPMRRQLGAALKHWKDGPIEIEIRPFTATRSQRANRYYWGVVLRMMAEEMNGRDHKISVDQLHEIEKYRHSSEVIADPMTGEEIKIQKSTATMSVEDFSSYLEAVMLDGNEWLGIVFPEPTKAEEWREAATA